MPGPLRAMNKFKENLFAYEEIIQINRFFNLKYEAVFWKEMATLPNGWEVSIPAEGATSSVIPEERGHDGFGEIWWFLDYQREIAAPDITRFTRDSLVVALWWQRMRSQKEEKASTLRRSLTPLEGKRMQETAALRKTQPRPWETTNQTHLLKGPVSHKHGPFPWELRAQWEHRARAWGKHLEKVSVRPWQQEQVHTGAHVSYHTSLLLWQPWGVTAPKYNSKSEKSHHCVVLGSQLIIFLLQDPM